MFPATLLLATCWMKTQMAKKKEKIIWVDDGRTIADMSGISGRGYTDPNASKHGKPLKAGLSIKEHFRTFFDAMGFMFLPTLAIVGLLALTFAIVYFLL